ncbi:alpha/beta hydrolase [Bifidobacterium vansinderenii]|uniref:Acetylesterase n=1 Tax=Bifidobacterium vansinderenii TaxID=1984871 RepID=A0A229VW45_9BIFI|nr:alpha/beta hydrolase [Bifidobacterium vansinderenii]OXM99840.1 acetylesterase [Bifidobacterium vansinderenii]
MNPHSHHIERVTTQATNILTRPVLDAGATMTTYFLPAVSDTADGATADTATVSSITRPLVVITPGGGYDHLSTREAEPIARRMNREGFHACVLRYSVAPAVWPQPLLELAATVAWCRSNATRYGIDPDRIVLCGFSAGAHLAGCLGTMWNEPWIVQRLNESSNASEPLATDDIRPNAQILSYPVITSGQFAHRGSFIHLTGGDATLEPELSLENHVGATTPPTFLWHTATDRTVPMENSLLFAAALHRNGIPMEMHIFPKGDHGIALGTEETAKPDHDYVEPQVQYWPELAANWIREL